VVRELRCKSKARAGALVRDQLLTIPRGRLASRTRREQPLPTDGTEGQQCESIANLDQHWPDRNHALSDLV
jgi:hypothetical protein